MFSFVSCSNRSRFGTQVYREFKIVTQPKSSVSQKIRSPHQMTGFDRAPPSRVHACKFCEKCFPTPYKLHRHMAARHSNARFRCERCERTYSQVDNLKTHQKICSGTWHIKILNGFNWLLNFVAATVEEDFFKSCTVWKTCAKLLGLVSIKMYHCHIYFMKLFWLCAVLFGKHCSGGTTSILTSCELLFKRDNLHFDCKLVLDGGPFQDTIRCKWLQRCFPVQWNLPKDHMGIMTIKGTMILLYAKSFLEIKPTELDHSVVVTICGPECEVLL